MNDLKNLDSTNVASSCNDGSKQDEHPEPHTTDEKRKNAGNISLIGYTSEDDIHTQGKEGIKIGMDVATKQSTSSDRKKVSGIIVPQYIETHLACQPTVRYRSKGLTLSLRVKFCKTTFHKKFKCSPLGLQDEHAISALNSFLSSDECENTVVMLRSREQEDMFNRALQGEEASLADFMYGDPLISYRKNKKAIQVELTLKNGKRISKSFPCSDKGKSDNQAMREVNAFLANKAVSYIRDEFCEWKFYQELNVGLETKYFFDKFTFDYNRQYYVDKNIQVSYPCSDGLKVTVTETSGWGKTHRLDEVYNFIDSTCISECKGTKLPAVTLLIRCSSKSDECRSSCLALLKDMHLEENTDACPVCKKNFHIDNKQCDHCSIDFSRKWYKGENDAPLCNACYMYQLKFKCKRPENVISSAKPKKTVVDKHLSCGWKMKLVLHKDDLTKWKVFIGCDNEKYHENVPIQDNKRPSLSIRDSWDKQRLEFNDTAKKIFSAGTTTANLATEVQREENPHHYSLKQISNRVKYVDKNYLKPSIKNSNKNLINGSDRCGSDKLAESNYESILLFQPGNETDIDPESPELAMEEMESWSIRQTSSQTENEYPDPLQLKPFMCGLCVNSKESSPYICSSRTRLFSHIMQKHYTSLIYCSMCWGIGIKNAYFANDELFEKHIQKYHKLATKQSGIKRNSVSRSSQSQPEEPQKKIKIERDTYFDSENPETYDHASLTLRENDSWDSSFHVRYQCSGCNGCYYSIEEATACRCLTRHEPEDYEPEVHITQGES